MFSSKTFIVSGLTFKALVHFEFIYTYGVKKCSSFILLHAAIQFSQHYSLKRLSFLHCIFLQKKKKLQPEINGKILREEQSSKSKPRGNRKYSILIIVISYDPLYFCGVCCDFFFISNFIDLSLLPVFLDESG